MRSYGLLARWLPAAWVVALGTGCGTDGTAPDDVGDPDALGLAVAVRIDTSTFHQTGELTLELIPSTPKGVSLVSEPWAISAVVTAPAGHTPELLSQSLLPPDTTPYSVALLVDNSASMLSSDPDRLRADAAELVWTTLLVRQPRTQLALLHFGVGGVSVTPGLSATGLLRTWTSDPSALSGVLDSLPVGTGSQIYSSALEVVQWIDTTTAVDRPRAILLLTDGKLNREGGATEAEVLAAAQRSRVSIGTVGLGPASDRSTDSDPEAVALLRELANGTGGLYAGAATPERLSSTLLSLTASGASGVLRARFRLSPVPAGGAGVNGRVVLVNDRLGTAQGPWSFVTP